MLRHLLGHRSNDLDVGSDEIVPAHAWLSRKSRGHDHHITSGSICIVRGAVDIGIETLHWTAAGKIEGLAFGNAFLIWNVQENHIAKFLSGRPMGTSGTDISSADDTDLRASHD